MRALVGVVAIAALCSSCATPPKQFYADPSAVKDTTLCRTFFDATDPVFQADVGAELSKRGLSLEECQRRVTTENAAIATIAIVGVGVAAAAACSSGCAAPYAARMDRDCRGGMGDGPLFVTGPVWVGSYDPDNLDADNDGWGCELPDMAYGA